VIEQEVEIPTPEGVSGGLLYLPEGSGPWPGTLFLTDIGGIRRANRGMARRMAEQGYAVLMPAVDFPFVPEKLARWRDWPSFRAHLRRKPRNPTQLLTSTSS